MHGEITHSTHIKPIPSQTNVGEECFRPIFRRCPNCRLIRSIDESHHRLSIKQGSIALSENVEDEYGGARVGAIGGDRLRDAARLGGWIDLPLSNRSTNQPTCEKDSGARMLRGAVRHQALHHNEVPCRGVWHRASRRSIKARNGVDHCWMLRFGRARRRLRDRSRFFILARTLAVSAVFHNVLHD